MRILILGGDGMLGHQLFIHLLPRHEVKVTLRQDLSVYAHLRLFEKANAYANIDVRSLDRLTEVLADYKPNVVINAIGIVKQRPEAQDIIPSLEINALLPHRLAIICKIMNARLFHLSTDCIYSGEKGNYREGDPSDARDIYGKTKFLGEVNEPNTLTLRTSIIGRELSRHTSLLDWFLRQTGTVHGFTRAIYSGFTTLEMSRIIELMMCEFPAVSGVYHVSSDPISKYQLLLLVRDTFNHKIDIVPDDDFKCDRSLDSSRFRAKFNYTPPSWNAMIQELHK